MLLNNTKFIVKSLVTRDQKEESTFEVSEDLETGEYIDTFDSMVSIVLQNRLGIERFIVTISRGKATIKMRGLGKGEEKTNNYSFQKQWIPGTIGYITLLASDLLDIDDATKTRDIETNLNLKGRIKFNIFNLPKYISEEERDENQKILQDGTKCFVTGIGEQVFGGGEWKTLGIATPVPNASEKLSGVVQIAKESELSNGIDIGDTGALLMMKKSQITTLINSLIPKGQIVIFSGDTAPLGYLICDGSAIDRIKYKDLFNIIQTKYGAGDGRSSFNIPNLKGRVIVGKSEETEFSTLGKVGGAKTHTLDINEIPNHNHSLPLITGISSLMGGNGPATATGNNITTGYNGGSQAHNNLQPYFTLNYMIKY